MLAERWILWHAENWGFNVFVASVAIVWMDHFILFSQFLVSLPIVCACVCVIITITCLIGWAYTLTQIDLKAIIQQQILLLSDLGRTLLQYFPTHFTFNIVCSTFCKAPNPVQWPKNTHIHTRRSNHCHIAENLKKTSYSNNWKQGWWEPNMTSYDLSYSSDAILVTTQYYLT